MLGQLWPLVVESNISDKPSVVQLQNEFYEGMTDNFKSFDVKQKVDKSVKDLARALLTTDVPHISKGGPPILLWKGWFPLIGELYIYRVTHHVGPNLPLTSKQKFRFSMRPMC